MMEHKTCRFVGEPICGQVVLANMHRAVSPSDIPTHSLKRYCARHTTSQVQAQLWTFDSPDAKASVAINHSTPEGAVFCNDWRRSCNQRFAFYHAVCTENVHDSVRTERKPRLPSSPPVCSWRYVGNSMRGTQPCFEPNNVRAISNTQLHNNLIFYYTAVCHQKADPIRGVVGEDVKGMVINGEAKRAVFRDATSFNVSDQCLAANAVFTREEIKPLTIGVTINRFGPRRRRQFPSSRFHTVSIA